MSKIKLTVKSGLRLIRAQHVPSGTVGQKNAVRNILSLTLIPFRLKI